MTKDHCSFPLIEHNLRLIVMDVDGVLTNGKLLYTCNNHGDRIFDVKDGMGVKLLLNHGLEIAWISGGCSGVAEQRAADLGVKHVYTSISNKSIPLAALQKELGLSISQTAYLGDDINDLAVLPLVTYFFAPADAHPACLQHAHWVGNRCGGDGFVREVADHILLNYGQDPYMSSTIRN
jgi:3-deoxy-D-manno-octulosonate 8-phosphate phosphatase (KDO 8-P phosphatase)